MVASTFLLLLVQGLLQYPQQAGDGRDEGALERMQQRAEYLNQQMTELLQELEQKSLGQSAGAWGSLLGWQFWAVPGILVVLLVLWFALKKMRCNPDNSGPRESNHQSIFEEVIHFPVAYLVEHLVENMVENRNDD